MTNKTDVEKGNTVIEGSDQGQQIERALVAPNGTITIPQCEAKLKSVDVADVDLLLSFSDGTFVVIPNGALDAISDPLHPCVFTDKNDSAFDPSQPSSDNKSTLGDLFKMVGITNLAKAGSLRVVSEHVDVPKTQEDLDAPKTQENEIVTSNDVTLSDNTSLEPIVKISSGGKGPGLGGSIPIESLLDAAEADPVAPEITPRPSVYRAGQKITDISDPTVTLDPNITADDIINIAESGGNVAITGTVGGTAQVGDTVTLAVNGNTYTGLVLDDKTFSIDVAGGDLAADGDKTIDASITSTTRTGTDSEGYRVDTQVATPTIALAADTGMSGSDNISKIGTLMLTGIEAGATIEYSTDGGTTWNSSFSTREGSNTVQVRQTDVAGNTSSAGSLTFTLDTTVATPTATLTTDSTDGGSGHNSDLITNNAALTISAAAETVTREYSTDGGSNWSNGFTPVEGNNNLIVRDTDVAGNSASTNYHFNLDTAGPVISSGQTFTYVENQSAGAVIATVAAADANGVTGYRFSDTGTNTSSDGYFAIASNGQISITSDGIAAGIPQNDYDITPNSFTYGIQACDAAGNWSAPQSITLNVTIDYAGVDTTPPIVTPGQTFSYSENQTNGAVVATVAATDSWGVTGYRFSTGSADPLDPALSIDGYFTIGINGQIQMTDAGRTAAANNYETGPNTFNYYVEARDAAGNWSASETITLNVTNVNEVPNDITLSANTVAENVAGAVIGILNVVDPDNGDSHTYTVDDPRFEVVAGELKLIAGKSLDFETEPTVDITITVTDAGGLNYSETFTLNVTNVNDTAVIGGVSSGSVTEDVEVGGNLIVSGALTIADADSGEAGFTAATVAGAYGSLTIDTAGAWSYSADNSQAAIQQLGAGDILTDTVAVTTIDGTPQNIVITITGTNDIATITGSTTGALTEDAATTLASGTLAVTDADTGETVFTVPVAGDLAGSYGDFTFNATTGAWSYTLDNARASTQALPDGQIVHDTLMVTSVDGTDSETIDITITGTNDGPVIRDVADLGFTEAADASAQNLSAGGSVGFDDIDANDVVDISYALTTGAVWSGGTINPALASQLNNGFSVTPVTDGAAPGSTSWSYSVIGANLDFLAAGETIIFTYTITATDSQGSTATDTVTVVITGTNDAPVVASTDITGAVSELVAASGNLTDSGTISFSDIDLTDIHSIGSITSSGGAIGTFIAGITTDTDNSTGTGGVVTWNYSVAASAVEYLAAGETKTETFTFNVLDGQGGSVARTVTVVITGTNDDPVISTVDVGGFITEGTVLSDSGSITFTDVDLTDRPTATEVTTSVTALAADGVTTLPLTGAQQAAIENAFTIVNVGTNTNNGTVTWDYTISESNLNFLAKDETVTATFTITVADGKGGTDTQDVTVTITGTNDDPVITGTSTGNTQEDVTLTNTGTLTSTDLDHNATAAWSIQGSATGIYGSLSLNGNTGEWIYSLANGTNGTSSAVQSLAAGQSVADTFTVRVTDDKGGFDDQTVTITIAGSNDAPVISGASTGSVQEDVTLTNTGTLTSTDIDNSATATWSIQGSATGTYGSLALNGNSGQWTYTLTNGTDGTSSAVQNLAAGQSITESFTVRVTDDKGGYDDQLVIITINGNNDAPVALADINAGFEGTIISGSVAGNDSDIDNGATRTYSLNSPVAGLTFNPDGSYSLDASNAAYNYLAAGENLNVVANYTVTDDKGATATSTLTVTLTGVNTPAVITGDISKNIIESNVAQIVGGDLDVTDPDNPQTFNTQIGTSGTFGTFSIDNQGTWTYTMDGPHDELVGGVNYTDTFTVYTADGTSQLVTIVASHIIPAKVL